MRVWNIERGQIVCTLADADGLLANRTVSSLPNADGLTANCMAFSPDGKRIVGVAGSSQIKVWDAEKGSELLCFKGHDSRDGVAFSSDGEYVASAFPHGPVQVWNIRTRKKVLDLEATGGPVAFSPDGKRIVTGHTVRELATGRLLFTCAVDFPNDARDWGSETEPQDYISSVTFSPDGQTVALAYKSGKVYLWDISLPQ